MCKCKFIRGDENGNNDNSAWIHWLQLTLITDIKTRKQGGGRNKSDRNSKTNLGVEILIILSKWVGGRSVQMKGIMEMRMETVPARHTGDLCRGLICN